MIENVCTNINELNYMISSMSVLLNNKKNEDFLFYNHLAYELSDRLWYNFFNLLNTSENPQQIINDYSQTLLHDTSILTLIENNLNNRFKVMEGKIPFYIDTTPMFLLLLFYSSCDFDDVINLNLANIKNGFSNIYKHFPDYQYMYLLDLYYPALFTPITFFTKINNYYFEIPFLTEKSCKFLQDFSTSLLNQKIQLYSKNSFQQLNEWHYLLMLYSSIFSHLFLYPDIENNMYFTQVNNTLYFGNTEYILQYSMGNKSLHMHTPNINHFKFTDYINMHLYLQDAPIITEFLFPTELLFKCRIKKALKNEHIHSEIVSFYYETINNFIQTEKASIKATA